MCSLRSWPVQNARPVPVSTTQRTAGSSAAVCTVSRSSTLVAMSRLFIASGRLSRIVATPSVTSYWTGALAPLVMDSEAVMEAVCPCHPMRDNGSAPYGVLGPAGPSLGKN